MLQMPIIESRYQPAKEALWHGRQDDARLFQQVTCIDLSQALSVPLDPKAIGFVGFACDEGVRRNEGRVGAAQGPDALRMAACNLPLDIVVYDFGTVTCEDGNLESSQKALGEVVAFLHTQQILPIVFGGGHEVAWGHFQGVSSQNIGVLNFDGHFDLRPLLENHLGSSGTPFTQIAEHQTQKGSDFSYTCLGIQQAGNTKNLFDNARQLGVDYVTADIMHQDLKPAYEAIDKLVTSHDAIYMTLCLDVFAAAFAPGVSAPQPLGLYPAQVASLIRYAAKSGKIIGFDIAELSPPYDRDQMTARLAASMLFSFFEGALFHTAVNN